MITFMPAKIRAKVNNPDFFIRANVPNVVSTQKATFWVTNRSENFCGVVCKLDYSHDT